MVAGYLKQLGSRISWALVALLMFSSGLAWAQRESPSAQESSSARAIENQVKTQVPSDEKSNIDDSAPAAEATDSNVVSPIDPTTAGLPIRSIGSAGLLDSTSHLRWGSFSIGAFSFTQAFGNINPTRGIGTGSTHNASVFSSQMIYDKQFQRSRFALQYRPRAMVFDGKFINNLVNQDIAFDTYYILGSRWTLGLGDLFLYRRSRNTIGDTLLDADAVTSTTLQNNFLQGVGTYLSNSVNTSLNYLWSARTRLTISPSYAYTSETTGASAPHSYYSSRAYTVRTQLTHDLSARTSIGTYQSEQWLTSGSNTFGRTFYQDFGGSISHQFGATWHVGGSFGAAAAGYNSGRLWTESSTAAVIKSFQHSTVALAYSRGQAISGYITNHLGERIDLSTRINWSPRLHFGVGSGYQRDITGRSGIWGKYINGRFGYQLTRSLSWVGEYGHKWQRGDNAQIFTGTENVVSFGFTWDPRPGTH